MIAKNLDPVRIVIALCLAATLVLGALARMGRPVTQPDGVLVKNSPLQRDLQTQPRVRIGDYELIKRAQFDIDARILAHKDYRNRDDQGDLVPVDLALGWGPMSDSANLRHIRIKQSNIRTYGWRYEDASALPSINPAQIGLYSANMHMIPATPEIRKRLLALKKGQVIRIKGYLVDIIGGSEGRVLTTSMTREDTGWNSCEIIYVERLSILEK